VRCGGRRERVWIRRPRVGELARVRPPVGDAPAVSFLTCPMPGVLTALYVAPQQRVEAGQTLATLEAMKMENWLCADRPATVGRVLAEPGRSLAHGERVLELLPR
jgi:propionyl-CoA carboxylase alpha chain